MWFGYSYLSLYIYYKKDVLVLRVALVKKKPPWGNLWRFFYELKLINQKQNDLTDISYKLDSLLYDEKNNKYLKRNNL